MLCAAGYLFELERRGYLQASAFVPGVVLKHPSAVAQLRRKFLRAEPNALEAFTYDDHRKNLRRNVASQKTVTIRSQSPLAHADMEWLTRPANYLTRLNPMNSQYETIVVGCGGIGSAALYWLSRRLGAKVLAIEQFELGHVRGSSQDHSRIFRLAQHQPEYADLARSALNVWRDVEGESGVALLLKTGGVVIEQMGSRDVDQAGVRDLRGYVRAMTEQGIAFDKLTGPEVNQRWPQFQLTDREQAIYQADSGLIDAAKSNAVHTVLAQAHGATVLSNTTVREIRPVGNGVEITTDRESFRAASIVIASGAWTNRLLDGVKIDLPITVTQEQVTYYSTPHLREFAPDRFPVWIWHGAHSFYGFPVYGEVATKMGQHNGGPEVTADTRTFEPDPTRQQRYRKFLERYLPRFLGPELYTKTCLYTVPYDQKFVLSQLPEYPQISVFIGAGTAFKFTSLMGKILSELALDRRTEHEIDSFRFDRPAIQDPTFRKEVHC